MNALLVAILAGFTGLFSAIAFRRAQVIESATNVDPNHLLFSAQEFTIGGIVLAIVTTVLLILSAVIASLNRG